MTTGEIAAVTIPTGAVLGWLVRHLVPHGNGNGKPKAESREDIRWQEEMRAMTKGISAALKDGNSELATALHSVAESLDKVGGLLHETHQRVSRIELMLTNDEPARLERRGGR